MLLDTWELIGDVGVIFILLFWIRWQLAKAGVLWTFVPENHAIPLDYGDGTPYKVLGFTKSPISHLTAWLGLPSSGIVWMGPPGVKIHEFKLVRQRARVGIDAETDHKNWIEREDEPRTERFLLKTVTHVVLVPGVEFKGNRRADILFQYQATVAGEEGVRTAVYYREGKFYDSLNQIIESELNSLKYLDDMDYDGFVNADKGQNSPMMMSLKDKVNETATQNTGYRLDHILVFRFEPSSKEEERLALLQESARIRKEAAEIEAQGDVADITELIKIIKQHLPNASEDLILAEVSKLGMAKRYANSQSLQAVGGAVLGLGNQQNQNKKKRRK